MMGNAIKCVMGMAAVAVAMASYAAPVADEVDLCIERGLEYLLSAQKPDGSFQGHYGDTVALPAMAAMACLSKGYVPGDKKYGKLIDRSLDFIFSKADKNGYMGAAGNGKMYSHAIATLLLGEVSGMIDEERQQKLDELMPKATKIIIDAQNVKKDGHNDGGWRYTPDAKDSDTSCSGWCLMALRSAKLNGAQFSANQIKRAVQYMHKHHSPKGCFGYQYGDSFAVTLSGAGILCLELCGKHNDPDSLSAARYLMSVYKDEMPKQEYKFYGMYYASQGLFQIGGENWKEFSEWMYATWPKMQRQDGSWVGKGGEQSPVYATSMMILAFTVPYRQLPIYQRDETVDES